MNKETDRNLLAFTLQTSEAILTRDVPKTLSSLKLVCFSQMCCTTG